MLDVVLMGATALNSSGNAYIVGEKGGLVGLDDLRMQPGGRHDNDHFDYRSIGIMITSAEVRLGN